VSRKFGPWPGSSGLWQWQFGVPQRPPVAEIEPGRKSPSVEISASTSERRFSKSERESGMVNRPPSPERITYARVEGAKKRETPPLPLSCRTPPLFVPPQFQAIIGKLGGAPNACGIGKTDIAVGRGCGVACLGAATDDYISAILGGGRPARRRHRHHQRNGATGGRLLSLRQPGQRFLPRLIPERDVAGHLHQHHNHTRAASEWGANRHSSQGNRPECAVPNRRRQPGSGQNRGSRIRVYLQRRHVHDQSALTGDLRSEEHTSELQSLTNLPCS